MEIDQAATLPRSLIIYAELLAIIGKPFPKDITCVSFISKFVKKPILRVFSFLPALHNLDDIRVHRHTSCGSGSFALSNIEEAHASFINRAFLDPESDKFC